MLCVAGGHCTLHSVPCSLQEWLQDVHQGLPQWRWYRIQDTPLSVLRADEGRVWSAAEVAIWLQGREHPHAPPQKWGSGILVQGVSKLCNIKFITGQIICMYSSRPANFKCSLKSYYKTANYGSDWLTCFRAYWLCATIPHTLLFRFTWGSGYVISLLPGLVVSPRASSTAGVSDSGGPGAQETHRADLQTNSRQLLLQETTERYERRFR